MITIAHLADLHFGRHRSEVVAGLLKSLNELSPELVVISGDLTQRAKQSEYFAAAGFVEQLSCDCLMVPGNHDLAAFNLYERFFSAWDKWKRSFSDNLQPSLQMPDALLVGLNTARKWASLYDFSRGRISNRQIDHVLRQVQQVPENKLRILVAHHPFWLPPEQKKRGLIANRDAAIVAFKGGKIDIILSGHIHMPYWQLQSGVIVSHAGTSCSDRLLPGQTNSFKLIHGDRSKLTISLFVWDGVRFSNYSDEIFIRDKCGWSTPKEQKSENGHVEKSS